MLPIRRLLYKVLSCLEEIVYLEKLLLAVVKTTIRRLCAGGVRIRISSHGAALDRLVPYN
ncbi:hypothetical protein [Methanopyrus sp.]